MHRPASRPPAPGRLSRLAAIIERNCPRVEGSQRKPHPVAIAIGLSMWDHTTGGRSHADVLMSGPPLLVLGMMLMRHDCDRSRGPEYVVALRALAHSRRTREAHLPRSPTGRPHRAPTCDPAPPQPVSLRTRTTQRAPLTVVVSDRSPMSLTLGVASVDRIRDREEGKNPHDIDLLIRGLVPSVQG